MRVVEYVVLLGLDGRRRVRHTRLEGKITEFMVQYEIFVEGKWHGVVRYDTSHGYAHKDLIHADGQKEKVKLFLKDLNICLTYAENDLRGNWKNYRERFLKEVARR
jgi:hypothetical protein